MKILAEAPKAARPAPRTMPHVHKLEQRMSAEVVTALVSDYKSGMTSTELRAKYELGKGSVQRLLREAKVRRRRHSLTNVEIVGLVQPDGMGSHNASNEPAVT